MAMVEKVGVIADVSFSILKIIFTIVAVITLVAGLCWLIYAGAIKPVLHPNPTTTQNAQSIQNNEYYPAKRVFGLGFTLWGTDIGIFKYDFSNKPVIKENNVPSKTTADSGK